MSNVFHSLAQLAEPIGADFGAADSRTQANLLNGFASMFGQTMPGRSYDQDVQMAYLSADLNGKAKAFLIRLAEFCGD